MVPILALLLDLGSTKCARCGQTRLLLAWSRCAIETRSVCLGNLVSWRLLEENLQVAAKMRSSCRGKLCTVLVSGIHGDPFVLPGSAA